MANTIDPATLKRKAWTTYMRNNPHLQCHNALYLGGKACAIGALLNILEDGDRSRAKLLSEDASKLAEEVGISVAYITRIVGYNDGWVNRIGGTKRRMSFPEIADMIDRDYP